MAVAGGGWVAARDSSRARIALDASWRENRGLRVRQETLRERAVDLAGRLEALDSGLAASPIGLARQQTSAPAPARY